MISEGLARVTMWGVRRIGAETLISLLLLLTVMGSIAVGLNGIADIQPDISLLLIAWLGWALSIFLPYFKKRTVKNGAEK